MHEVNYKQTDVPLQRQLDHAAVTSTVAILRDNGQPTLDAAKAWFETWLRPLAKQLKNQSSLKVVNRLEEILSQLPAGSAAEAVQKELNYFHEHAARMDYRAGRKRGEPIGSGPAGHGGKAKVLANLKQRELEMERESRRVRGLALRHTSK